MMKSSGLSTEPWCTPNFTTTSSLRHSSVHSRTFFKLRNPFINTKLSHCQSDHFLRNLVGHLPLVHESHINLFAYCEKFLLQLADDKDCICCASAWEEPKLLFVNSHHLSYEAVCNSLNDFHSLLHQFLCCIVASVNSISPFTL